MSNNIIQFQSKQANPMFADVFDIDPQELLQNIDQLCLIDVRQPEEYVGELGHIAGAKLIVLDTIPQKLSSIPEDKTVVFICRSGGRSAQATAYAAQNGRKNIYNMLGGMLLWNKLQLPTTTKEI